MNQNEPKPTLEDREFFVSFNTIDTPTGSILKGVKVTIEEEVVMPTDTVRIDLADHPLYPALAEYVKGNPRRNG